MTYQAQMHALADEAQQVVDSTEKTSAQKRVRLEEIQVEIKALQDRADLERKANQFRAWGAGSALPPGVTAGAALPTAGPGVIGAVAPIGLSEDSLHGLHDAMLSHKSFRCPGVIGAKSIGDAAITKATTSIGASDANGPLDATRLPGITAQRYEQIRLMDLLPASAMGGSSVDWLQHTVTTGAAGTVSPGTTKPSVSLTIERKLAYASKIAVTATVNDEDLADFPAFQQYVLGVLTRLVITEENSQITSGDGTAPDLLGLLSTTGIQTLAATTGQQLLDVVENGITLLRTGAAFCEPTAIVTSPNTWSLLRQTKDSQGRYLVMPNGPSQGAANELWGVPVVATTGITDGEAIVLNARLAAQVYVRSGLEVAIDYGQTGFEQNQHTLRAEERVALTVPYPAAICHLTGLTSAN